MVISLWKLVFNYTSPQSKPELVIDKKIRTGDGLFFVMVDGTDVIGTILAGYDGHRGWLYSLCVATKYQKKGVGTALVEHAEAALISLGCVKINLQVVSDNAEVVSFYHKRGYQTEPRISMGKLITDNLSK
jgi:ribosomal protein S18 acetylase RimI-like enzyme